MNNLKQFIQAFSEFLGRPKTVFDIKDRFRLLVLLVAVVVFLESIIYFVKNCF